MKKLNYYILLFITFASFGQDHIISKYEKADINQIGDGISKLLSIDKKEFLILQLDKRRYVTFNADSTVTVYCASSVGIYKEVLNKEMTFRAYIQLDSLRTINPNNLNITTSNSKENDSIKEISVEDGVVSNIRLFSNDKTIEYSSYAAETYIEYKFPFYKDRLKLINAISFFESLFTNQKCFEKCDLIEKLFRDEKISKYFHHNQKNRKILYLIKSNFCSTDFEINSKYNVISIDRNQIKKNMNYIELVSIEEKSFAKIISLSYPIEGVFFKAILDYKDEIIDIKVYEK